LNAKVAASKSSRFTATSTTIVRGEAVINTFQNSAAQTGDPVVISVITLLVSGVKQSDVAPQ
jgi:hypothetical protein